MKSSEKKFVFEMVNLKSSSDLIKSISKFLQDIDVLKYGSHGILKVSVDYENFNEG